MTLGVVIELHLSIFANGVYPDEKALTGDVPTGAVSSKHIRQKLYCTNDLMTNEALLDRLVFSTNDNGRYICNLYLGPTFHRNDDSSYHGTHTTALIIMGRITDEGQRVTPRRRLRAKTTPAAVPAPPANMPLAPVDGGDAIVAAMDEGDI